MNNEPSIWKFEGPVWSNVTNRQRVVKYWCLKIGDKVWEGFATKTEAKDYADRYMEIQ